ncbi:unnamed protein product [Haemonchus placei]|uniref:PDZ domain-containing protein n=1 Tax=Haemonchus placei TaxID=6290 RepID=A0A0N4WLF3_HAEPC|nr:unnamed protein product [Haemonchus placei]
MIFGSGETLLRGLDHADKKLNEDESIVFDKGCDPTKISMITLDFHFPNASVPGLGFNIVGGKDSQHIPGHSGIFVSIIKADGPAYKDGRLSVGDLVLSVIGLIDKTHDEAVSIFRSQNQSTVDLLVEVGAENRILNVSGFCYERDISCSALHFFEFSGDLKGQEEDSESITSGAPSVHSILDDTNNRDSSLTYENWLLYVSIGLAVISLGVFVVYRFIRRRR